VAAVYSPRNSIFTERKGGRGPAQRRMDHREQRKAAGRLFRVYVALDRRGASWRIVVPAARVRLQSTDLDGRAIGSPG